MSHYIHDLPGRLRVRIPCLKSRKRNCLEVEEILAAMPGVIAARANVLTGGVLVCYQAETLSP
jgi:hypothetical protein